MWKKVGMIGLLIVAVIPLLIAAVVVAQMRYNASQKSLIALQKKNNVSCVEVDEYFNTKGNRKIFGKLDILSRSKIVALSPQLSIHTYFDESPFKVMITEVLDMELEKEYNINTHPEISITSGDVPYSFPFIFSERPIVGLRNNWYVLSQNICAYANGICTLSFHQIPFNYIDEYQEIAIPKKYLPIVKDVLYKGVLEGGVKGRQYQQEEASNSSRLRAIVGIKDKSIFFSLSNRKELVAYDINKMTWTEVSSSVLINKLSTVELALKDTQCIYYSVENIDLVLLRSDIYWSKDIYMGLVKK